MRLSVQGAPGELATRPEDSLGALADAAEADGADRSEWLEKALRSVGAVRVSREVSAEPSFRVVDDKADRAVALHRRVMTQLTSAIRERLDQAAREADTTPYLHRSRSADRRK